MDSPYLQIHLYDMEESRIKVPSGFELNPRGRFAKLQQWLWDKARKAGIVVQHFDTEIKVRRIAIDRRDIPEDVMKAIDAVHAHRAAPREILMGPATFRQLWKQASVFDTDRFEFELLAAQDKHMFGLKVEVLPWMEGLLVR